MRIAIYARVSTKDKGQDTENQLIQLREFCRQQVWIITREFVDQYSGKTDNRPEFKAMMEGARRREFDQVLFWSLDRFSREGVLETLQHLQRLTAAGVGWRSFTEQYLDSCGIFKDAVLSILATIAKQERIRLSERVTAGMQRAKEAGAPIGRPKLILDRLAVKEMAQAGQSARGIARILGVSAASVCRILKNNNRSANIPGFNQLR